MPKRREWTEDEDRLLRDMRADNRTWGAIGIALRRTHENVRQHAKLLGAWNQKLRPVQTVVQEDAADDRDTLEAGHHLTWGAIVAGTVLEGCEYPGA